MFAVRSRTDARGPLPIAARETKNTKAQSTRPAANGLTNFVTSHGPGACRTRTTVCVIVATALAAAIFATVPAHGEMRMKLHMGLGGLGGDVECIALNIYHEARGEPDLGKLAVGHVVMNRVSDSQFPNVACEVVRQGGERPRNRCQFSWWCDGRSDRPKNSAAWQEAIDMAKRVYNGRSIDPTQGALWYHADYVLPYWQRKLQRGPVIGRHVFYRRNGEAAGKFVEAVTQANLAPPPRVIVPYAM